MSCHISKEQFKEMLQKPNVTYILWPTAITVHILRPDNSALRIML